MLPSPSLGPPLLSPSWSPPLFCGIPPPPPPPPPPPDWLWVAGWWCVVVCDDEHPAAANAASVARPSSDRVSLTDIPGSLPVGPAPHGWRRAAIQLTARILPHPGSKG